MITEEQRFFAPDGALWPGGPSTWNVLDWDQRRIIAVTMDEEQEEDTTAINYLRRHIDNLAPNVYEVHISTDGHLLSVSTDPAHDANTCVWYPFLDGVLDDLPIKTVLRSQLIELERLTPNVDIVCYGSKCPAVIRNKKIVFKYYFLFQFMNRFWTELSIYMRFPSHPNIVSFDRLVLDELEHKVVGFTTRFIPGGTIEENDTRVFKLDWLTQLTATVDDLNLRYGISHQDIAPRNLLVDPDTGKLLLCDFDVSARIGTAAHFKERDDIKGVIFTMYEVITKDTHFREVPHEHQNYDDVMGLSEWVKHPIVSLDHPVECYRALLTAWVESRSGIEIVTYTDAPYHIDWPAYDQLEPTWVPKSQSRTEKRSKGEQVLKWERPPAREQSLPWDADNEDGEGLAKGSGDKHDKRKKDPVADVSTNRAAIDNEYGAVAEHSAEAQTRKRHKNDTPPIGPESGSVRIANDPVGRD